MLYHGTSAEFLNEILNLGIHPRKQSKGNWSNFPSKNNMVYLTRAYAFYFAMNTIKNKTPVVVFEMDENKIDKSKFYPDEDFLEAILRKTPGKISKKQHNSIRNNLEKYGYAWAKSLELLGNCCYKGIIPIKAITRYCVYDRSRPLLNIVFSDPNITIMNYKLCGEKYKNMISWMFGDRELLPQVEEDKKILSSLEDGQFKDSILKRIEYWTKESSNRKGIEIIKLNLK